MCGYHLTKINFGCLRWMDGWKECNTPPNQDHVLQDFPPRSLVSPLVSSQKATHHWGDTTVYL